MKTNLFPSPITRSISFAPCLRYADTCTGFSILTHSGIVYVIPVREEVTWISCDTSFSFTLSSIFEPKKGGTPHYREAPPSVLHIISYVFENYYRAFVAVYIPVAVQQPLAWAVLPLLVLLPSKVLRPQLRGVPPLRVLPPQSKAFLRP